MKKLFLIGVSAMLLSGCATAPRPQASHVHHVARPVAKPVAQPITQPVEKPATFKQRWYDRFRVHPSKWFHRK